MDLLQNTETFTVINVVFDGEVVSPWMDPLQELLIQISKSEDRLAKNYSLQNVNLKDHLSFDLLVNSSQQIVSFCGVFNGNRYPAGVYRILNRTWTAPEYRVRHGRFQYLTSRLILPVQIRAHREKLKMIFLSRERLSGQRFLKKWKSSQSNSSNWHVSDQLVQVVPGVEKPSCYQFICSQTFEKVDWNPQTLSADEWKKWTD